MGRRSSLYSKNSFIQVYYFPRLICSLTPFFRHSKTGSSELSFGHIMINPCCTPAIDGWASLQEFLYMVSVEFETTIKRHQADYHLSQLLLIKLFINSKPEVVLISECIILNISKH